VACSPCWYWAFWCFRWFTV